jgi:hypothetical protein
VSIDVAEAEPVFYVFHLTSPWLVAPLYRGHRGSQRIS